MSTANHPAGAAPGPAPDVQPDVELLGRRGCHLCDEAKAALGRIAQVVPLRLHETDVDSDFALRERYGLLVPVVLVGGERVSELRLDEGAVRERLVVHAVRAREASRKGDLHAAGSVAGPRRTGAV
jgi:hypothetical protein